MTSPKMTKFINYWYFRAYGLSVFRPFRRTKVTFPNHEQLMNTYLSFSSPKYHFLFYLPNYNNAMPSAFRLSARWKKSQGHRHMHCFQCHNVVTLFPRLFIRGIVIDIPIVGSRIKSPLWFFPRKRNNSVLRRPLMTLLSSTNNNFIFKGIDKEWK